MGKATTYTYNALGKVESITDSLNHRTEFTYNSRGQNTEVCDAANNASTATYDLLGNVTRLAGPLGGATNYTYDDMGRLVSESTVSGGTVQYTYNELNVRKKITSARGQSRQIFYDVMGRITGFASPEGAVSYTYDANGNITDTFAYDTHDKLVSRTGTSKVIFGYNGRDGVVTDDNGLIYMRARYYSPEMKRFINAIQGVALKVIKDIS